MDSQPILNQKVFFSRTFQKLKPLSFYVEMYQKVISFASSFDKGSKETRTAVWKSFEALISKQIPKNYELHFFPYVYTLSQEQYIDLFVLEMLYVAFMIASNGTPDPSCLDEFDEEKVPERVPFSPFGSTLPAVLNQLVLLIHWSCKLEKQSGAHKLALWRMCKSFPTFGTYDPTSFRKTFKIWAQDPITNFNSISILFGAVGFLKEANVLKGDFCFPKTAIPVYSAQTQYECSDSELNLSSPDATPPQSCPNSPPRMPAKPPVVSPAQVQQLLGGIAVEAEKLISTNTIIDTNEFLKGLKAEFYRELKSNNIPEQQIPSLKRPCSDDSREGLKRPKIMEISSLLC